IQPPDTPEALYEQAVKIAAEFGDMFVVELTSICVHFLFRHLHKGSGVQWLAEATEVPLNQMAGIGDAAPDLPFLEKVGYAYAPANAHDIVKNVCHGVSPHRYSDAALELLDKIISHNQYLKRGKEEVTTG